MPHDFEKTAFNLERLGKLIDRYAQSRSLGLWASTLCGLTTMLVIVGSADLTRLLFLADSSWWFLPIAFGFLWVLISTIFIIWFEKKRRNSFYNKIDGRIEIEEEKVSIWVACAFLISFLSATIFSAEHIMPIRWALTLAYSSFGIFTLYLGKKKKDIISMTVYGGLFLIIAIAIGLGMPTPFASKKWIYSYFTASYIYYGAVGLVTMIVVHLYNRRILRKIKEMRLSNEQQKDK